jgi:hypothetical protein
MDYCNSYRVYKLRNWIPFEKINWEGMSQNPNAIYLLEQYPNKINWRYISLNTNAIHIIRKNLDKIDWDLLSKNSNAIQILEENMEKINWKNLSCNSQALHLIEKNMDKINWIELSRNLNSGVVSLFEKEIEEIKKRKIDPKNDDFPWTYMCNNPIFIDLLSKNKNKINWSSILANPKGMDLWKHKYDLHKLNEQLGFLDWFWLSMNPNIIDILEKYINNLDMRGLIVNPNAIHLLEKRKNDIDWLYTRTCENPNMFEYDYSWLKERMSNTFGEELIANRFHPSNFEKWIEWGFNDIN